MTYAITGAGRDARAVLAAKDIPILIANSRGPETLDELAFRSDVYAHDGLSSALRYSTR